MKRGWVRLAFMLHEYGRGTELIETLVDGPHNSSDVSAELSTEEASENGLSTRTGRSVGRGR